jgi:lipopolysaccharide/colanic/teichoic acid biosynthesis glycosyltransferase
MPDAIQRTVALPLSALTIPLVAAAAVAVRIESRGAPIYASNRVGEGGRPFTCPYGVHLLIRPCPLV